MMSLEAFWKITDLIKEADYLMSSKEQMADIQAIYKSVFKTAGPYAIYENDRLWLLKRSAQ